MGGRGSRRRRAIRRSVVEQLEARRLLTSAWQYGCNPLDIDTSGYVSPLDALLPINDLNAHGSRTLPDPGPGGPPPYYDSNGDTLISPIDVLLVINALNGYISGPIFRYDGRLIRDTAPLGATNDDGLTSDPRVAGQVTSVLGLTRLQAQLDGGKLTDLSHECGAFTYDPALRLDGTDDGPHTVTVHAADPQGRLVSYDIPFVLDTLPPQLSLALAAGHDTPPLGDSTTRYRPVDLVGDSEPGSTVHLEPDGMEATADGAGRFTLPAVPLADGENPFTAWASDAAGNLGETSTTIVGEPCSFSDGSGTVVERGGSLGGRGGVEVDYCEATMREGDSFLVSLQMPVVIPDQPSELIIRLGDRQFDTTSSRSIRDAFEMSLRDETGRSLVHTFESETGSFFNLTEGRPPALGPHASWQDGTVKLDVSALPAGRTATLALELVNDDGDGNTSVTIRDFSFQARSNGAGIGVTPTHERTAPTPVDLRRLVDVSASLLPIYGRTSYAVNDTLLFSELALENVGNYEVRTPLLAGIRRVSDPDVRVLGFDQLATGNMPFFNLSDVVGGDALRPGEITSGYRTLKIRNPAEVPFQFELVVLGHLNGEPTITSRPDVDGLVGRTYRYQVEAVDTDGDGLDYTLLAGPGAAVMDAATGLLTWTPQIEDVGTHQLHLRVADGHGGLTEQTYTLSIREHSPNRPPVITSLPLAEAMVSISYDYSVNAFDADGDPLQFALATAPVGMSIDADNGTLEWTPEGNQVGQHDVAVSVADDRGGSATQTFVLTAQVQPGNHAPIIISTPVEHFHLPDPPRDALGDVAPDLIDLRLPEGATWQDQISLTLPATNLSGTADVVFIVDESGSMVTEQGWIGESVDDLDAALNDLGISDNRYALVAFGGTGNHTPGQRLLVSSDPWTLGVFGPGGQLAGWTDFELGPEPLELTLPWQGEYTFIASNDQLDQPVTYSLVASTPDTVVDAYGLGALAQGTIARPGEQFAYTFSLSSRSYVYFDSLLHDHETSWTLEGARETIVAPQTFHRSDAGDGLHLLDLEPGDYMLTVDREREETGEHRFRLWDLEQATPITPGTPIVGELSPAHETDLYRFPAIAGDQVRLEMQSLAGGATESVWRLVSPFGQVVFEANLAVDSGALTLPNAGTYTLLVEGSIIETEPRSYTLQVAPLGNVPPVPPTGTLLTLGTVVTEAIASPGEQDHYVFDLAERDLLFFDSRTNSGSLRWSLTGPTGTVVDSVYFNRSDAGFRPAALDLVPGSYLLTVEGVNNATGNYSFRLSDLDQGEYISLGVGVSGELDPANEAELYRFDAVAGQSVYLDMVNLGGPATYTSSVWRLLGPFGHELSRQALWNDHDVGTLAETGTYTLVLDGTPAETEPRPYTFAVQPLDLSGQPLALGETAAGAIDVAGDRDEYALAVSDRSLLYFDSLAHTSALSWTLEGPAGTLVDDRGFDKSDASNAIDLVDALPGDYTITVDASGDTTRDYGFRIWDLRQATPISLGAPTSGVLDPGNETDLYRFEAFAGDQLFLDSQTNATGYWRLLDPAGVPLAEQLLHGDIETVTLPTNGTYTILAEGLGPTSTPQAYTFQAHLVPDEQQPLVLSDTISQSIAMAGERDSFTFSLQERAFLYFDALTNRRSLVWSLKGPTGEFVKDMPFDRSDAWQGPSVFDAAPGDYVLTVDGTGDATGDYAFRFWNIAQATEITPGSVVQSVLDPGNESALFRFEASAGQHVYLDMIDLVPSSPGGWWRLIDPYGKSVTSQSTALDVETTTLEHDGTYTIILEGLVSETDPLSCNFNVLPISVVREPLTPGQTVNGSIGMAGEQDIHAFTLTNYTWVYFDSLTDSSSLNWMLSGQSGPLVGARRFDHSDLSQLSLLELAPGDYEVIVDGKEDATGDYAFRFWDVSEATPIVRDVTVTGTLEPGNETDLYRFSGVAGDQLALDMQSIGGGAGSGRWKLIGPYGRSLADQPLGSDVPSVTLVNDGDHVLLLEGRVSESDPGTYSFEVVTLGIDLPDSPAGTPIALDTIVAGSIDVDGEEDSFLFELSERTRVYLDSLTGNALMRWTLEGPAGTLVDHQSLMGAESHHEFYLSDLPAGTYRLIVDAAAGATGSYGFRLWNLGSATDITPATPVDGQLNPGNETRLYQFEASRGDLVYLDMQSVTGERDAFWRVIDRFGRGIVVSDLQDDIETFALPFDGTYTLAVGGHPSDTESRSYTFNVQPVTYAEVPLAFDTTIQGSIEAAGERDGYTFDILDRTLVYFDSLLDSYDMLWTLEGPTGSLVSDRRLSKSDSSDGVAVLDLPAGRYMLSMDLAGEATGDYRFRLLDMASATTVVPGTTVSGSLDPGTETDLYRFEAQAGNRFYLDMLELGGGSTSAYWRLIDPMGGIVATERLDRDVETIQLDTSGTFTLVIEGKIDEPAARTYQFKVQDVDYVERVLNLGETVTDSIGEVGERDVYHFTLTDPSLLYFNAVTDTPDVTWTLQGPTGTLVDNWRFDRTIWSDSLQQLGPGPHTLTIDGTGDTAAAYEFRMFDVAGSPEVTFATPVSGTLDPAREQETLRLSATRGQRLFLEPAADTYFGNAAQFATASTLLRLDGQIEDGYDGIDEALDKLALRDGAAVNLILITDEDRDTVNPALSFQSIAQSIQDHDSLLNVVVNASLESSSGIPPLGVDAEGNAFIPVFPDDYTVDTDGRWSAGSSAIKQDYADLAWFLGGAVWDLNQLRLGGAVAGSFSNAFRDVKVREIERQLPLEVMATDATAPFQNLSGVVRGFGAGETATFDVQITGDDLARSFDLQFVRPGTGNILGRIPVRMARDYAYQVQAVDPDDDPLTYSLLAGPAEAAIDPASGLIRWRGTAAGTFHFDVLVDDGRGGQSVQPFDVTVTEGLANQPPVIISSPPSQATVSWEYHYQAAVTDPDDDSLRFGVTAFPAGLTIDPVSGIVSWTPADNHVGTHQVTLVASDGRGASVEQSFSIEVAPDLQNSDPTIVSVSPAQVQVGHVYRYDAIASDPDADRLTYDLSVRPTGMTVDPQTGTIVWSPIDEDVGLHRVILRVSDGHGGVNLQDFDVEVLAANILPAIRSQPGGPATADLPFAYQVLADDAEDSVLHYRLEGAPAGMAIGPNSGMIAWTPTTAQVGTHNIAVVVSDDDGGATAQTFALEVVATSVNRLPAIVSIPRKQIQLGRSYVYETIVDEPDGDPLTFRAQAAPAGMSLDERGLVEWNPTPDQLGSHAVVLHVDDGRGGVARQEFAIDVELESRNTPPVILSTPPTVAVVGKLTSYKMEGYDADGDRISWVVGGGPQAAFAERACRTVFWRPSAWDVLRSPWPVTVFANDSQGGLTRQDFEIHVRATNLGPVIRSTHLSRPRSANRMCTRLPRGTRKTTRWSSPSTRLPTA